MTEFTAPSTTLAGTFLKPNPLADPVIVLIPRPRPTPGPCPGLLIRAF